MTLFLFFASYFKTQRALQWWTQRQARQLSNEAEKIRDGLLQESFAIRRSLELSNSAEISPKISLDLLNQIEQLYRSLEQLSEQIFPLYLDHSLPLAIQSLVELWRSRNPRLSWQLDLPTEWRHDCSEHRITVLKVLEELLEITSSQLSTETPVYISLKLQGNVVKLIVHTTYSDASSLISNAKELEYLSQTFRFLTAGRCFRRRNALKVAWYFSWA